MRPNLTHIARHVCHFDDCLVFYKRYCQLEIIHQRKNHKHRVAWLAEHGRESELVFVLISGGPNHDHDSRDFSHFGFALDSVEAVDRIAHLARKHETLLWEPQQKAFPVGYFCGIEDPDGVCVEFSFGQPLGPGAEQITYDLEIAPL
ncbi:MAG: glyoxalase/bleomycin resistance/dioxygenase family protein [Gammaproteobacteria bacterium]|nr:MAG: glyoxalase/bleomycin resistance/dioxygenase family protein [Gammaproteobacteria bacterium]